MYIFDKIQQTKRREMSGENVTLYLYFKTKAIFGVVLTIIK